MSGPNLYAFGRALKKCVPRNALVSKKLKTAITDLETLLLEYILSVIRKKFLMRSEFFG